MCLDISGKGTVNGTNAQMYNCNNTPAQLFKYDPSTKLIHYKQDPKKCLHIHGPDNITNGQNINIWDCIPNHPRFKWDKVGNTFKSHAGTNKCMHVYGSDNITNGQNVTAWDCLPTWKRFNWL